MCFLLLAGCAHLNGEARFTTVSETDRKLQLQFIGRKPGWISIDVEGTGRESGSQVADGWSTKSRGSSVVHFDIIDNTLTLWPNPATGEEVQLLGASEIKLENNRVEIGTYSFEGKAFRIVASIESEDQSEDAL